MTEIDTSREAVELIFDQNYPRRYDNLRAAEVIARALLARAEKAEAARDEWKDEYRAAERLLYLYKDAATNRQAERDTAWNDAIEAAKGCVDGNHPFSIMDQMDLLKKEDSHNRQAERDQALAHIGVVQQNMRDRAADCADMKCSKLNQYSLAQSCRDAIQAIPLDSGDRAAQQQAVDAAWNEAVESAAKIVSETAKYHMSDPDDIEVVHLTATEILALKRPEASHE